MPVWFPGWTLESRSGRDTPSVEEWMWYHVTPGSTLRTGTSDDPEDLEYYVTSSLFWLGIMGYSANAAAAAAGTGVPAIAAELTLYRAMVSTAVAGPVFAALGWASTSELHGGVVPGELGMGMPVTDPGMLSDMQNMSWSDLWPF